MKYEVLIYPKEIDTEKLNKKNIVANKCEVPINMNDEPIIPYKVRILEKIKFIDYLKNKKFSDGDIEDLADYTINKIIPKATQKEKEDAKKSYLEDERTIKLETFIIPYKQSKSQSDPTIIITNKNIVSKVLELLGIKQNLTTNFLLSKKIQIDDFLLWIYWLRTNNRSFQNITLINVSKDSTVDLQYPSRFQNEIGGNNVTDSYDLKYRIGNGYRLNKLSVVVRDEIVGAKLEIGISLENKGEVFITPSGFYASKSHDNKQSKSLYDQLNSTSDLETTTEIYKNAIAINILDRLIDEYIKDYDNWQNEKPNFIAALEEEAKQIKKYLDGMKQ